ncbi:hypothetical protein [Dyella mobilis]|uniref:Lipoprotein n=1 Tax=Dyella mobilis TaxID=1849582 RepID=A0ABS2KIL9_9GAMM|nr:hypothetical protein [Dyella mobilis]MBM7130789.1 hypothetical protein [Dyella mobilis]GLQ97418.1 hypothetical protein GCM10007863_18380 [Dyella mobilis]
MKRRILHILALAAAMGSWSTTASANQYDEVTLGEKVANSDVVVIGKVTSVSLTNCLKMYSCAAIKIVEQLNGAKTSKILVLFDGPIAEENPICCKVGATYLFFLKHAQGPYFGTVNGPYGIYRTN